MVKSILALFAGDEKAAIILENALIEFIFLVLFIGFLITLIVHLLLFQKLKKIRNYLKETNRLDMKPLSQFKELFDLRKDTESVRVETFVQEMFSGWRVFQIPIISLIKIVQMTVSVFILIGVLGTFIGLTISLGGIQADGNQLVENIAGVLAGIDVAFYTSIAGMGMSLIMTVLIKVFNTEDMLTDLMLQFESSLEGDKQHEMGRLIDVSEAINQSIRDLQHTNEKSLGEIVGAFSGFQAYTTGLEQAAKDLAAFNEGLSENLTAFQTLFQHMREVTDGFGDATNKLHQQFGTLFAYFKKMDDRNERLVQMYEGIHEKMVKTQDIQLDTLQQFEKSVETWKEFSSNVLDGQSTVREALQRVVQTSGEIVEKADRHQKEFKQIFGADLTGKLAGISTYLGELVKDFDALGHSIVKLPEALDTIQQTQTEYKHLLSDRFDELKDFNRSFGRHIKAHVAESGDFERKMQEAAHTYEQFGIKNNQFIQEINQTINQMNQANHRREHQLDANVGFLKDTLANYVSNLEGTLGNKLELIIREIVDSVDRTNAGIKTEFQELRRISEEMQQYQSRGIQNLLRELGQEIHMLNQQLHSNGRQRAISVDSGIGMRQNEY